MMNYEFLLELGWKSSLVAASALLLVKLMSSRSPADRAIVLQVATLLLLALPLLALFLPPVQVDPGFGSPAGNVPDSPGNKHPQDVMHPSLAADQVGNLPTVPVAGTLGGGLILFLYLSGVALVITRLLLGVWTLRRWTTEAARPTCPRWMQALERAEVQLGAIIPVLVSDDTQVPLSWGGRNPVILIDRFSYGRPANAEAILMHEVAHILRRDWLTLILARVATAVFWFNPLVWVLEREFQGNSEAAADARAVAHVEPAHYAQVLLDCAVGGNAAVPANSIGSHGVAQRVQAVLNGDRLTSTSGSRLTRVAVAGCIGMSLLVSPLEFIADAGAKLPSPVVAASLGEQAASAAVAGSYAAAVAARPAVRPNSRATISRAQPSETAGPGTEQTPNSAAVRGSRLSTIGDAAQPSPEAVAREGARLSMIRASGDMAMSAQHMRISAGHLSEEAANLRSAAYREKKIAEYRERGRDVTHRELLDAIPDMEVRSRQMLEDADGMDATSGEMLRKAEAET